MPPQDTYRSSYSEGIKVADLERVLLRTGPTQKGLPRAVTEEPKRARPDVIPHLLKSEMRAPHTSLSLPPRLGCGSVADPIIIDEPGQTDNSQLRVSDVSKPHVSTASPNLGRLEKQCAERDTDEHMVSEPSQTFHHQDGLDLGQPDRTPPLTYVPQFFIHRAS